MTPVFDAQCFGRQIHNVSGLFGFHSVFENSLNLILLDSDEQDQPFPLLLTLTHGDADHQEYLITLKKEVFFQCKELIDESTVFTLASDALSSIELTIRLPEHALWQSRQLIKQVFLETQIQLIESILQARISQIQQPMWYDAYQKIMNQFLSYQQHKDITALEQMLGLGIGLTPSGDDFLLGLFAALQANEISGTEALMQQIVKKSLKATTTISQHYLHTAAKGFFSGSLIAFNRLDQQANEAEVTRCLHSILQKGATSGLDTALGYFSGITGLVIR